MDQYSLVKELLKKFREGSLIGEEKELFKQMIMNPSYESRIKHWMNVHWNEDMEIPDTFFPETPDPEMEDKFWEFFRKTDDDSDNDNP